MTFSTALAFLAALTGVAMAIRIAVREQRSIAKATLTAGILLLAIENLLCGFAWLEPTGRACAEWQTWRMAAMALIPAIWLAFSLSYGRGKARESLARWKAALVLLTVLPAGVFLAMHGRLVAAVPVEGQPGAWTLRLGQGGVLLHVALVLGVVGVLMNLERTLRAATGTMRWRVKFMVVGAGVIAATRLYTGTQAILFSSLKPAMDALNASFLAIAMTFMFWSLRRSTLMTVDLYPSHTVIYRSLSALLAGLYLLGVGILAQMAAYLGEASNFPLRAFLLFVGLAGLAALFLSDRMRLLTKRFVSRHFRRPEYDYRKVWERFTSRTAAIMDSRQFCRVVAQVVSETFEVLSVTLWIVDEARDRIVFGESTSLGEAQARALSGELGADRHTLVDGLLLLKQPIDIEAAEPAWTAILRRCNPMHFEHRGGHRICVPLMAGGGPVGAMVLGDRVRGLVYTDEEIELLKTLGGQVAASLLTIQLSERLLHAKQLEAFQAMSAFFVHDLKNTSSTLSLMLQNLPRHFGDPSFRDDALKAMGQSVGKINDLIRRLSLLRQKLEVRAVPADIDHMVSECLRALPEPARAKVTFNRGSPPTVSADAEQFQKVILNLLLNAHEATGAQGAVEVGTEARGAWAVLSVRDNGAGMEPEFVERSLFHPFKSTKREGLGIGLFHSRMIVEAHGGRIEAASAPGQGSTFTVRLPLAGREQG